MYNGTNRPMGGEYYLTVDPSRKGKDLCVIRLWNGYIVKKIYITKITDIALIVAKVKAIEDEYLVPRKNIIVDDDGLGGGVVDFLPNCAAFVGNASAFDEGERIQKYRNLKTQTVKKFSDLVKKGLISVDKNWVIEKFGNCDDIFTQKTVQDMEVAELECYMVESDLEDKYFEITKKKDIKKTIKRSPDLTDTMFMRAFLDISGAVRTEKEYSAANVPHSIDSDDDLYERFVKGYDKF